MDDTPLVEDDAPEKDVPHPTIPAEMPGVVREEDVEAISQEQPEQVNEVGDLARAAVENANFGPREEAIMRDALGAPEARNVAFNVRMGDGRENIEEPSNTEAEDEHEWGVDPQAQDEEGLG